MDGEAALTGVGMGIVCLVALLSAVTLMGFWRVKRWADRRQRRQKSRERSA
jgi:hypothetical protein